MTTEKIQFTILTPHAISDNHEPSVSSFRDGGVDERRGVAHVEAGPRRSCMLWLCDRRWDDSIDEPSDGRAARRCGFPPRNSPSRARLRARVSCERGSPRVMRLCEFGLGSCPGISAFRQRRPNDACTGLLCGPHVHLGLTKIGAPYAMWLEGCA